MNARRVPVAVVGAGHLGTFHARLYAELESADLRMVVDLLPEKAEALGKALGVPWSCRLEDALEAAEAISVACSTTAHGEVAARALGAGRHVLVEKPITATVEEGRTLTALARERGLILAVGHTERWNPAFRAALPGLGRPRFIESHRLAPFVPRSLDVDVVLDLMIHDVDLTLSITSAPLESIDAIGVPVLTEGEDIANARLRFADGAVANLTASRVSREKTRKVRVFGDGRYHSIDLLEGRVEQVILERAGEGGGGEESAPESDLMAALQARGLALRHGALPVPGANALKDELLDFLFAVRGAPLVGADGDAGLRSLEVALEIRKRVRESLTRIAPARAAALP